MVRLDALGVVDHQLGDTSEEERDVVVMPGAALDIRTAPIFPHEIIIFLVCFVSQALLLPHHIYLVSRHNQLEAQVCPDEDNNQCWLLVRNIYYYLQSLRGTIVVGPDVIIQDEVFS